MWVLINFDEKHTFICWVHSVWIIKNYWTSLWLLNTPTIAEICKLSFYLKTIVRSCCSEPMKTLNLWLKRVMMKDLISLEPKGRIWKLFHLVKGSPVRQVCRARNSPTAPLGNLICPTRRGACKGIISWGYETSH